MFGRLNWGDVLSVPMGLGCCDFHKPSQNLVNSFKTANGLPEFDSFNNKNYDKTLDKVDPRLYHTVALPGVPYKYNEELIYQEKWNRNPSVYGLYASLKENVDPSWMRLPAFATLHLVFHRQKQRLSALRAKL